MKKVNFFLVAVPVIMLACNSQPKADKNMQDDAILLENAEVNEEKDDSTYMERDGTDTSEMGRDTMNKR